MKLCKIRLLSNNQLKNLRDHQYSCQGTTILERLFLLSYWDWLTLKVPIWIAPNLITVVGLIVNVVTTLILVWYSPDAKQEAPKWACGFCAVGIFIYQTLDGIDGKQARRTGTANPLGELFDHGCDAISIVLLAVALCIGFQAGDIPEVMLISCFLGMTLFYLAHWQKYVSGTLHFGHIDVIEAEFATSCILLVSSVFGPSVWSTKIFGLQMEMKCIILIIAGINAFFIIVTSLSVIFRATVKNESTVAGTNALSPAIPLLIIVVFTFIIWQQSAEHIYEEHPCLFILTFGLATSKVCNSLMVAQMTKSGINYINSSHLGAFIFFLNQCFGPFVKEYYLLWFCLVLVLIDLLLYCYQICAEISDYLGVKVFKIPYLEQP
ncbi:choline/ethanolaminephosphotransferase 1-like [Zophobas morio]|uniref:choline/ethanolaminephosphotransferase 1-like n=1 Tax=Zophobas morio TaxID=2755281 RepID=UPI003083025A